jgi:hypothetical protein
LGHFVWAFVNVFVAMIREEKSKKLMRMQIEFVTISVLLLTGIGGAQTVTTSGGTTNVVPKFSGAATLANSAITEANGNVGIGVANPVYPLDVTGYLHVSGLTDPSTAGQGAYLGWNALTGDTGETDFINNQGSGGGGFAFMNTPESGSPRKTLMVLDGNGNLNISGVVNDFYIPVIGAPTQWAKVGTFTAAQVGESIRITAVLHSGYNATNVQDSTYFISFKTSNGSTVDANGFAGNSSYYAIGFNNAIPPGDIKWVANAAGVNATSYDLYINLPIYPGGSHYTVSLGQSSHWTNVGVLVSGDPGAASATVLIPTAEFDVPYGNVGIGTNVPGAKLEVNGNVKLTAGSGASITFPDNTIQSTAWNGTLYGGDYAESVDISGDRNRYEAGDILVLDPEDAGHFLKSSKSYSALVAGIYSTKPGVLGRRQTVDPKSTTTEVPMAIVGIVPTKVSAENGAIKTGDLLVTSSTPGLAMKGTDRSQMFGAVVGKAMGSLDSGTGVIEVLVSLQ